MYGRQKGSQPSQTFKDSTRCQDCRLIHEVIASADVMTVTALPGALLAAAASVQLEGASETLHAYFRASGGCLSIPKLTRHRAVVGQSPDRRGDRLSRRRGRVTVVLSTLESRRRALSEGVSDVRYGCFRTGSGCLSIDTLSPCHTVMRQSLI